MRTWIGRALIGAVLAMNLQCAVAFIINPEPFLPAFELAGVSGMAALRGVGVLFVMWSVPYCLALWHPAKYRLSLYEAIVMQFLGLAGETAIFLGLPLENQALRNSLLRFILFDGGGWLALLAAAWISRRAK